MTRHMTTEALLANAAIPPMTKAQKIERWASLVLESKDSLRLYHGLEWLSQRELDAMPVIPNPASAFGVALADPVFKEAGLKDQTIGGVQRFFELSKDELHEFSCDCGGQISARETYNRMMKISGGKPKPSGLLRMFG